MRRLLVIALLAAAATAAQAQTPAPLQPDLMTVSGRWGLPSADAAGPLRSRLRLVTVEADDEVVAGVGVPRAEATAALSRALSRSLNNHGYLASSDEAGPIALTARAASLRFTDTEDGAEAVVRLRLSSHEAQELAPCLDGEVTGRFRASAPARSGGARRALGLVVGAALLAPGYAITQLQTADAENAALNGSAQGGESHGVAPAHGRAALLRHAALGAHRAAIAAYLRRLAEDGACRGAVAAPSAS